MMDIYCYLDQHNISYTRYDHPPVFTCEEAAMYCSEIPGIATKNMFLRDKKGVRHILVAVPEHKRVDIKALENVVESTRLSFASPERLKKYLGVEPGSVTLLGLIHDSEKNVEVVLDTEIEAAASVQCHPLVNTATLDVAGDGLKTFLEATGHKPRVVDVPGVG